MWIIKYLWTTMSILMAELLFASKAIPPTYPTLNLETILRSKAHTMLKYMNPEVDPCRNFYEFACGNWSRIYPANSTNHLETSTLKSIQSDVDHLMLTTLSDQNIYTESPIDKKVKNFYQSCMNMRDAGLAYKKVLKGIIAEFGQMPAVLGQKWSEKNFDWLKTIAEIASKYDINIILGRYIRPDMVIKQNYYLNMDLPSFGLKEVSIYLDPLRAPEVNEYNTSIAQQLKIYLDMDDMVAQNVAKEIVDFEIGLAKGAVNESVLFTHSFSTVENLEDEYSGVLDLDKYLEIVQGTVPTKILDKCPQYHEHLAKLIKKTPQRIVANYIYYSLMRHFMVSPPFPMSYETLQTTCVTLTRTHFGDVVDNMVYRKANLKEAERAVTNMVYDLKTVFGLSMRNRHFHWINETVQQKILEKLQTMKLFIKTYQTNNFSWKYGTIISDINDFVGNLKSLYRIRAVNARSKLDNVVQIDYEEMTPLSYLPKYLVEHNALVIPVGFLQPFTYWSSSYPPALNLAQMGYLIAHEFIHAIDVDGAQFGNEGQLKFWFYNSYEDLKDRVQCFRHQYKGFSGNELLDSQLVSENVADVGGLRLAYKTYTAWENNPYRHHVSNMICEILPGLQYTGKQLFFISFAQLWCSDVNSALKNASKVSDDYSPGRSKVMNTLSHLDEFSEVFQCPANDHEDNDMSNCFVY
ncbi:endothelin-converting enzyme 1-like [Haematobia irritans]|uniref:endothelin-converting enzyme 1-like n=1 Tax=Haematobia irritans TaxID=7368 RepID=UPI003F4FA564